MFRRHSLGGVSVIAIAWLQPATIVHAQTERELPSVTVDAPRAATPRAARKPAAQARAARAPKPAAASAANTSVQGPAASVRVPAGRRRDAHLRRGDRRP